MHGLVRGVGPDDRDYNKHEGDGEEHVHGVCLLVHLPVELVIAKATPVVPQFLLYPFGDLLLGGGRVTARTSQMVS